MLCICALVVKFVYRLGYHKCLIKHTFPEYFGNFFVGIFTCFSFMRGGVPFLIPFTPCKPFSLNLPSFFRQYLTIQDLYAFREYSSGCQEGTKGYLVFLFFTLNDQTFLRGSLNSSLRGNINSTSALRFFLHSNFLNWQKNLTFSVNCFICGLIPIAFDRSRDNY